MVSASEHAVSNSALDSDPDSYAVPTAPSVRCRYITKSLDIFRRRSCGLLSDDAAGVTVKRMPNCGEGCSDGQTFS